MLIEALFLAQNLDPSRKHTVVLIDVLRASATLIAMVESGARDVLVVGTPEEARAHRARLGACVLCGEAGGSRPADFDLGNSPSEYFGRDLRDRQLVFTSSNGAKAITRLAGQESRVFIGSFPNADAVVQVALADAANREADIAIVASGRAQGTRYGIEDCHCAGFLVDRLIRQLGAEARWVEEPPAEAPHQLGERWLLEDSAFMALQLYRSFGLDFGAVLLRSGDAKILEGLGPGPDFVDTLRINSSRVVPEVTRSQEGQLVVNPA